VNISSKISINFIKSFVESTTFNTDQIPSSSSDPIVDNPDQIPPQSTSEATDNKPETIPSTSTAPKKILKCKKQQIKQEEEPITIKSCIQKVEAIFQRDSEKVRKNYKMLLAPDELLMDDGEVPESWLMIYKDTKKWKDFEYVDECNKKLFRSLNSLLMHYQVTTEPPQKLEIQCSLCNYLARGSNFVTLYINHVTTNHYEFLKFCCIVCSKVFRDMQLLLTHYKDAHPDHLMAVYPCLDCGRYLPNSSSLVEHKLTHILEESNDDDSD